jgi:hypothetical protein
MDPPPGVKADLENPEDVLWSINLVTQSLTLAICSFFVLTRVLQRFRMPGWILSVDECTLSHCIPHLAMTLMSGRSHNTFMDSDDGLLHLRHLS